jgi:ribosome-associated protein
MKTPSKSVAAKPRAKTRRPATKRAAPAARKPSNLPRALPIVEAALADMKAVDVRVIDVRGLSDVADFMVIASGTSDRHLRSVADRVVQMSKAAGQRPLGVEGEQQGEWVLVDLPDVMVHIMLPRTRELYQLEQLWDAPRKEPVAAPRATKRRRPAATLS